MNSTPLIFLWSFLFSLTSFAQSLTTTLGAKKYDEFPLAVSSQLVDGSTTDLKAASHGLRQKKVFALVIVKVYYAELLAAKPEALVKDDEHILDSLKTAGPVQLRLTLLRDLGGKKISESFAEALEANGLNEKDYSSELKQVLEQISQIKEFKKGDVFSIVGTWKDKTETLYLQKPDGTVSRISGETSNFVDQIFKIWFGKPVDEKLASLKKELMK